MQHETVLQPRRCDERSTSKLADRSMIGKFFTLRPSYTKRSNISCSKGVRRMCILFCCCRGQELVRVCGERTRGSEVRKKKAVVSPNKRSKWVSASNCSPKERIEVLELWPRSECTSLRWKFVRTGPVGCQQLQLLSLPTASDGISNGFSGTTASLENRDCVMHKSCHCSHEREGRYCYKLPH